MTGYTTCDTYLIPFIDPDHTKIARPNFWQYIKEGGRQHENMDTIYTDNIWFNTGM